MGDTLKQTYERGQKVKLGEFERYFSPVWFDAEENPYWVDPKHPLYQASTGQKEIWIQLEHHEGEWKIDRIMKFTELTNPTDLEKITLVYQSTK